MNWQNLLNRSQQKKATVKKGSSAQPQPRISVEPAQSPAFGNPGFLAERPPERVAQPVEVRMKDQVMGTCGQLVPPPALEEVC